MTKVIILTGLQASGKSEHASKLAILEDAYWIESDHYRERYFDNRQDKKTHQELFNLLHAEILGALAKDSSVVFDATNLSYKHRMELIKKIRSKFPTVEIISHVVMTQFEICAERDASRERSVGYNVIKRARESFTMPQYYEGFNEIHISYAYNPDDYDVEKYVESIANFDQKNPNHSRTLKDHMLLVYENLLQHEDHVLETAGYWHDNGKRFTQVFENMKREPSEHAHYYSHENVGAYETFFFLKRMFYSDAQILDVCGIIQNHMRPYGCKTEKSKEKLRNLVGQIMYDRLMKLNEADKVSK